MKTFIFPEYDITLLDDTDVIVTSGCGFGSSEDEDCFGAES